MRYARYVMSRVYRALEKAEREKEDKLRKKTFLEKPRVVEGFQREEMPLKVAREKTESLSLPIMEEVPVLIAADNPFAAEEFRKLKTQVFHWSANPPHVILVTSATPDEGKTIVSVNLAMAISMEMQKEAILIDADLRKPSVHFQDSRYSKGLSNYLADQTSLSDILVHSEVEKLRIIPAGPPSKKSAELIASRRMEELLTSLRTFGEDTYIIIDSPPGSRTSSRGLGEFRKVGDSEEELTDLIQEGQTIVPNNFILDHDHDLIKECIDGLSHLGHLKDSRFIGPLL